MPAPETLLTIILAAIAVNLVVGVVALIGLRGRPRDGSREARPLQASRPTNGLGSAVPVVASSVSAASTPRPVAVFGPPPSATPAGTDPATGLDLAPAWSRWLAEEDSRVRRYRRPATLVLIDVDGLDRLIERLGADAADRLLPPVAATLRRYARGTDRIARLGPSSFAVLLPETDEVQAINFVERIRTTCDLWLESGAVACRLALGWAETNPGRAIDLALSMAQDRLNAERRRGHRTEEEAPAAGTAAAETVSIRTSTATS